MNRVFIRVLIIAFLSTAAGAQTLKQNLDAWRTARFGMLVHFTAAAQLKGWWKGTQYDMTEWIMQEANIPAAEYAAATAGVFNPAQFSAKTIVSLAAAAGQKYLLFTAKHHDGFSMWNTGVANFSPYDIVDATPWKQDPLRMLADECAAQGVRLGALYSIKDWHHPAQGNFGDSIINKAQYISDMKGQLRELVQDYGIENLWFVPRGIPSWFTIVDALDLRAYIRGLDSGCIVTGLGNDVVGLCDYRQASVIDRFDADFDWETFLQMNGSWVYRDFDTLWKPAGEMLGTLVDCASKNANLLLNIGPDEKGVVPAASASRLQSMGAWLKKYGESIYGTHGSPFPLPFSWGKVTAKQGRLYLHVVNWPGGDHRIAVPRLKNAVYKAYLLNDSAIICPVATDSVSIIITLPAQKPDSSIAVVALACDGFPRTSDTLFVNDANPAISYTGSWSYGGGRNYGDYKKDVHSTTTNGDYFEHSFTGAHIDYLTELNADMGLVDIYVDGVLVTSVNCYNPTRLAQQTVWGSDLPAGNHTIKVVKKSGTYMLLDALRVPLFPAGQPAVRYRKPLDGGKVPVFHICRNLLTSGNHGAVTFSVTNAPAGSRLSVRITRLSGSVIRELASLDARTIILPVDGGNSAPMPAGVYLFTCTLRGTTDVLGRMSGLLPVVR